jgi:Zn-dependent protease
MILGRLRGRQDKGSLTGALVKGGFVVVKASRLLLALASFAAYTFLFTWQFAVIILGMLVIHEYGHLRCMKHYGMRTRGIYLIPFFGAAAVAGDDFPSRRAEATIALAGPLTGAVLAGGTGLLYFATRNGAFAAAAAWMALINLFNLLPVVPLDGGRAMAAMAPWMWFVGFGGLIAMVFVFPNPILLIIILFGGMETWRRWQQRKTRSLEQAAYYRVAPRHRLIVGAVYIGLIAALAFGMYETHILVANGHDFTRI